MHIPLFGAWAILGCASRPNSSSDTPASADGPFIDMFKVCWQLSDRRRSRSRLPMVLDAVGASSC